MNREDTITINEFYTFKKSEIQGFISDFTYHSNNRFMTLYIIISGNKIEVDDERCNDARDVDGDFEIPYKDQLKAYHKKWKSRLEERTKKEMI
jgi:hypothetical protein